MAVFKSRSFLYAKDPEHPEQNQDAFQVSEAKGMAVVADGVSSAIFSAAWAKLLSKQILLDRPDPADEQAFAQWLASMRSIWEEGIDTSNLSWFQRPKLASGAFTTLLWVTVREIAAAPGSAVWKKLPNPVEGKRAFHVKGYCIGDSCLFHVRPGRTDSSAFPQTDLYQALPLTNSRAFDMPPVVIGSKDLGRDGQMKFKTVDFLAQEDDLVILATDAVSQWILKCYEEQAFPRWDIFWNLKAAEWEQELDAMRAAGEIRYDDSTLLLLQLGDSNSFASILEETQEEIPLQPQSLPASASGAELALDSASSSPQEWLAEESVSESELALDSASSSPQEWLAEESVSESELAPDSASSSPQEWLAEESVSESELAPDSVSSSPQEWLEEESVSAFQEQLAEEEELTIQTDESEEWFEDADSEAELAEDAAESETFADWEESEELAVQESDFSMAPTPETQTMPPVSEPILESKSVPASRQVPNSAPQGGFQYRMASSASARKFGPTSAEARSPGADLRNAAGGQTLGASASADSRRAGSPRVSSTQGAQGVQSSGVQGTQRPASHTGKNQVDGTVQDERANQDAQLADSWHQLRESSAQIVNILGGRAGERISEGMDRLGSGMNRVGSQLNESVSNLSESAKPKLQSMAQRFAGFFKKKNEEGQGAEKDSDQAGESTRPPVRVIDPNRRRYYNPPKKD